MLNKLASLWVHIVGLLDFYTACIDQSFVEEMAANVDGYLHSDIRSIQDSEVERGGGWWDAWKLIHDGEFAHSDEFRGNVCARRFLLVVV